MPNFTPRVNASRYDYPKYFEWWEGATAIAQGYNKAHRLREGMIVSLFEHYLNHCLSVKQEPSKDHFMGCITAFCDRDMSTISRIVAMLEGREPLEFKKPAQMNEMPGRERMRQMNQETMGVAKFLDNLKADPNAPLAIAKPSGRAMSHKKRLPEGWMNEEMRKNWMIENHPDVVDQVDDYFEYLGFDPGHGPVWKLIVRVSQ